MTIKELRLRDGYRWSQVRLGIEAGVSTPVISRIENGLPVLEISLRQVCNALNVSVESVEGVKTYSALETAQARKPRKK